MSELAQVWETTHASGNLLRANPVERGPSPQRLGSDWEMNLGIVLGYLLQVQVVGEREKESLSLFFE